MTTVTSWPARRRSADSSPMMIAVENQRSRFNSALGLHSQGFKDRCEIPAAGVAPLRSAAS